MSSITHAIILAGGKGERLRPITNDRTKAMVEIGGRPILSYQVEQFRKIGIKQIVFTVSYQKESLMEHVGDGSRYGIEALYSIEDQPLGRGGGIKQAMNKLTGSWDNVLITNGDTLFTLDLPSLINQHLQTRAIATDVVVPLKSPYGIVEFDNGGHITGFKEKPILPHWINAGIYIFSKQIKELLPDIGDHETETFPNLPKERFFVFKSDKYWKGIDNLKDLTEATKELESIFGIKG